MWPAPQAAVKFILPSEANDSNLKSEALKGLKTVKIVRDRRLIFETALLQPLEFILFLSSFYSFFHICICCGNCPHFFPAFTPPSTTTHLNLSVYSTPPSILASKYPFLPLCFFLFLTVNLSSSVAPHSLSLSLSLSFSLCPASLFSL